MFLQRLGEVFMAIPGLPILLVMGAALSGFGLPATTVFMGIIAALAIVSWAGMARVIRGQVLAIRQTNISGIEEHPWLLVPGVFIVVSVLAFNFMGDALRDAVDPFTIV